LLALRVGYSLFEPPCRLAALHVCCWADNFYQPVQHHHKWLGISRAISVERRYGGGSAGVYRGSKALTVRLNGCFHGCNACGYGEFYQEEVDGTSLYIETPASGEIVLLYDF